MGTWEMRTGAGCGRSWLSASTPDHDPSGNREPLEGVGPLQVVLSTRIAATTHAQWKRGVRDQRQGTGLVGTAVKARVNNGASRKEWESRYKKESGGKTLIHLCVLFPPHQHLHCHFKMASSAWIKKNININNYNL